jgi:HSP20 family protein
MSGGNLMKKSAVLTTLIMAAAAGLPAQKSGNSADAILNPGKVVSSSAKDADSGIDPFAPDNSSVNSSANQQNSGKSQNGANAGGGNLSPADPFGSQAMPQFGSPGDMFSEMNRIQNEMNAVFERAWQSTPVQPGQNSIFQQSFAQSMNVQDKGNYYEVVYNTPDRDSSNVDVKVEGQMLNISSKQDQKQQKQNGQYRSAQHMVSNFSEALSLPGPVKANEMKIERQKGRLVITIPKA